MSETPWTPGKWEWDGDGVWAGTITKDEWTDGSHLICTFDDSDLTYEQCEANARLIAAAPELVAALGELLETQNTPSDVAYAEQQFHRNEGEWEKPGDEAMVYGWHDRRRDAQVTARALLARIRGEASDGDR